MFFYGCSLGGRVPQDFKGVGGVYDNVFAEGMPGELDCSPNTW